MLRRMLEVLVVELMKEKLRLVADYTNEVQRFRWVAPSMAVVSLSLTMARLAAFGSQSYLYQVLPHNENSLLVDMAGQKQN